MRLPVDIWPGSAGRLRTIVLSVWVVADIIGLALLRLHDAPGGLVFIAQLALLGAFAALAIFDLPVAVGIVVVELAVGGAGGGWTVFPGGISGRIALDAIVFVRSMAWFFSDVRNLGRAALGRYGAHAVLIAILMPAVWIPLGLLSGHRPQDVIQDGDAYLFLAFTLTIVTVMRRVGGQWFRSWLMVACASTAVFTGLLLVLQALGIVPLWPTVRGALIDGPLNLAFGGQVGFMPSGAWRLYLGSGLYLQVGLTLAAWRLLERPKSMLIWLLYSLLLVDVIASYTRGFWYGSIIALVIVLVLGFRRVRSSAILVGGTASILLAATLVGGLLGFSLPDYLLQRASSTLIARPAPTPMFASPDPIASSDPIASPDPRPSATVDYLGEIGNQIRLDQARILLGHVLRHPVLGEGFGAIAPDYPYAKSFRYELSFLDLAYKTGIVGFLLFMSYPLRLLLDLLRARAGRLSLPGDVGRREVAVPAAIMVSVLAASATNPYLLGAFGLLPLLLAVAWLDPIGTPKAGSNPSITD